MKRNIIILLLLFSAAGVFAQTKLIVNRKNGIRDSIAVNNISRIGFSSSGAGQPSIIEIVNILDTTRGKFLKFADDTNGSARKAIMLTGAWLRTLPYVKSVTVSDSLYISIALYSGLITGFYVDLVDPAGYSLFRGGGGGNRLTEYRPVSSPQSSTHTITNLNTLWYSAANSQFYTVAQNVHLAEMLELSPAKLKVVYKTNGQCTPKLIQSFKDYGLVFLDSHGNKDCFLTGQELMLDGIPAGEDALKASIIRQMAQEGYDWIKSGDLRFSKGIKVNEIIPFWQKHIPPETELIFDVWATSRFIEHLPEMPNTVIYGNMCFSGNEDSQGLNGFTPIKTAFMALHPISYYAFQIDGGTSAPVANTFGQQMMDSLIRALLYRTDSTGNANLNVSGKEFSDKAHPTPPLWFRHFGADDYSYLLCGDTLTDARDGHKYTTVCIGKQKWMAQNLNYNAPGSIAYDNNPVNGLIYGRLYDFKTIMQGADSSNATPSGVKGICPKGWHVPSTAEFETLFDAVGFDTAGGALKAATLWDAPNTGATNSSGFKGLPGGFTSDIGTPGSSMNLGLMAYFATTTVANGTWTLWNLVYDGADIQGTDGLLEKWGVSCRCLKD